MKADFGRTESMTRAKKTKKAAKAAKSVNGKKARARRKDAAIANGGLSNKEYSKTLKRLHVELVRLQEWVKHTGLKVCIIFEGRDGAGKGGTIKAITDRVSPRVFRVVALPSPTEREKTQMYVQRYLPHLPAAGEIVIFDRSWYNRAGVERVMGFCTEEQAKVFLKAVPLVERAIIDSGAHIPESSSIGFDREADRAAGYTVTESGIVVVPSQEYNVAKAFVPA